MCEIECCWCFQRKCTHYHSFCDFYDFRDGEMSIADRQLYESVKAIAMRQSVLAKGFIHLPALYPCYFCALLWGICCEQQNYQDFKKTQLDQSHRFTQTVCCFVVGGFTLKHDPGYKGVATSNVVPTGNIGYVGRL